MKSVLVIHTLILFPAAFVAALLGGYAWRRREMPPAKPFAMVALGVAIWTFGAGIYPYLHIPAQVDLCIGFEFFGISIMGPSFLAFTTRYAGWRKRFPRGSVLIPLAIAIAICALVATDYQHHLVWSVTSKPNVLYYVFLTYWYLLSITSLSILLGRTILLPPAYRWQGGVMLVAGMIPLFVSLPFELGIIPRFLLDPTPPSFVASVALAWWGLFRLRLLDLNPIAHSVLLENMKDGMFVVDVRDRILDMNRAAIAMFHGLTPKAIGHPVQEVIEIWPQIERLRRLDTTADGELSLAQSESTINLEVHAVPLKDSVSQLSGHLFLVRDVTDRVRADVERTKLIAQLQSALGEAKTLRELLPMCSGCKSIRDEFDQWHRIDTYIAKHTKTEFTHGLCPDCIKRLYPDLD